MQKKIKIGIDGRALEGNLTGIGRYVYELCRVLDQQLDEAVFYVYSRIPLEVTLFSNRWHSRVEEVDLFRRLGSNIWFKSRCGVYLKKDYLDFFWGAATLLPQLPSSIRTVVTVYDLNYLIAPETMGPINLLSHRLFFARDVRKAGTVLTISQGTADRLKRHIGVNATGIIYPAVRSDFVRSDQAKVIEALTKYGIRKPYHLSVATWEPRKNLELLLRTYVKMKTYGEISEYTLVLVGGKGWKDEKLLRLINRSPKNCIVPLGFVPDEDLPHLYSGADAFIFPSIYEGFGIPLLEARACGTTIIATDMPELRESGRDGIFIEPTEDGIRKGIIDSLSCIKSGINMDEIPSWQQEGQKLAEVFKS